MIDRLVDAGAPVDRCCRILGITRQNYYKHKRTPTTPTQLRRQWLTGLIREVHVASRGTYGYRRIHAELTLAMSVQVCPRTVSVLMTQAGIYGAARTDPRQNGCEGSRLPTIWSNASSTVCDQMSCGSTT